MAISTAVSASAVARVVGIKTTFRDLRANGALLLPQRVAVVGQGASASTYATTPLQITSAQQAGTVYGFGSPIHLAAKQLLPSNGDGVGSIPVTVYPLEDDGAGVPAAGDITPVGTATEAGSLRVSVNNILSEAIAVVVGDTVADLTAAITTAVTAVLDMPVLAVDGTTVADLTAKWDGASGNDLFIEMVGSVAGLTFGITQPTSGATNPDVDDALNQVGNVWETLVLNCMDLADTGTLDKFATWNEGRWGALVNRPAVVFTGLTEASVTTAITVSDARKTDRTNSQLVAPGSTDIPLVVAARQLARIAVRANDNPAHDYGSMQATGLVPGTDGEQWDYAQRDQAVKAGSSTVDVRDSVVTLADIVTMYHPTGDPLPAYRHVADIIKLMNIIFGQEIIFRSDDWDGAPLIPDDQPTSNRSAKKPKMAVADVAALIDGLALNAILSDPATAKASIVAGINESNPKRLDLAWTAQLSGNANIISIDSDFGFFFGTAPVVA